MFKKIGLLAAVALAPVVSFAQTAPTLPDATTQLTAITTSITGYATPMFLLAITAVGVMVGVKWIKRGKSAA